ncbi:MAG: hypothetical protein QOD77_272 [Thermoplasmata archaeon]|jgi:hypothetical protein|nr:hypothetical protein [Thermoplasmata archaeon]
MTPTADELTVVVDRIVLEDPNVSPERARRIHDGVERRVQALLQERASPQGPSLAPPPGADDEELVDAVARAVVAAVRRQGGPDGDA